MENYEISFEEARNMPVYSFHNNYTINELMDIKSIENVRIQNVPVILEFGCIDIEMTVHETDCNDLNVGYYICTKDSKGNWDSYDYTEDKVIVTENLEKDMFDCLMKYAKMNNLYWSKGN